MKQSFTGAIGVGLVFSLSLLLFSKGEIQTKGWNRGCFPWDVRFRSLKHKVPRASRNGKRRNIFLYNIQRALHSQREIK